MIGVLALQGGFHAHLKALARLGVAAREVRLPADLKGLDGIILPGGESTTILKLLHAFDLSKPLTGVIQEGLPVLATCAGSILLCDTVTSPQQESLGLLPAEIERNAYGCQRESFQSHVDVPSWNLTNVPVYFIRAPVFRSWSDQVEVLCTLDGDVAGVGYGHIAAVTFHPELAEETRFHEAWLHHHVVRQRAWQRGDSSSIRASRDRGLVGT